MNYSGLRYLVVGCGFWGAVFAQKIASVLGEKVLIIDRRKHIGGNSYSKADSETGIDCHSYGSHIFHTSSRKVWDYVNQFSEFNNYKHKVLTTYQNKVYPMPINLATINMFYNLNLTPFEAEEFIENEIKKSGITNPKNLEEKAISLIGEPLYGAFIKGYTQKQWGVNANLLPAQIVTRLPVRYDYNFHYFSDTYEGIPLEGYGKLFENILHHENIEVKLNTDYKDIKEQIPSDCKVIYTGMVDGLFNYKFGQLGWRSLEFKFQKQNVQDWQGTSVMNFGDEDIPYTRCHEFKHFHVEKQDIFNSNETIICIEYPKSYNVGDEAYYPINDRKNNEIYELYKQETEKNSNLIVGGRLGKYKYFDMDKTIEDALESFEVLLKKSGV